MKNTNFEKMTIQQILGFQTKIEDLLSKCATPFAPPDSVTHNVQKVAEQLLAAADKIMDVGRDLNGITSCMLGVADDSNADDRDAANVTHILAWAGWTCDLTQDVVGAVDDLIRSIHDLIGSDHGERAKGGS
jgi:hypothetical protein